MLKPILHPEAVQSASFYHLPAESFPTMHPVDWLHSHFAVGGWSPLQRLGDGASKSTLGF